MENKKQPMFDKKASACVKGVAIILMLYHHCFLTGRYEEYEISFWPFSESMAIYLVPYAKICVSLFAMISGYGLWLSAKNSEKKLSAPKWIIIRYIKSFSGFWVVWVLMATLTTISGGLLFKTMKSSSVLLSVGYTILDFLGIANLLGTPTLLKTWWYMGAAFLFILLTPLFAKCKKKIYLCLIAELVLFHTIAALGGEWIYDATSAYPFVFAFLLGNIAAEYDVINRIIQGSHPYWRLLLEIILIATGYWAYHQLSMEYGWELMLGIIPLPVLLFIVEFVARIPGINTLLGSLGKHSINIYLIHNFLRGTFLKKYVYGCRHFVLVVVILLGVSWMISVALEFLKKQIGYTKGIDVICKKIAGK